MVTRQAHTVILALLILPLGLAAADLWKSKPVHEWTQEETERFLRNSPWVRQATVRGAALSFQPDEGRAEREGAQGVGTDNTSVTRGNMGAGGRQVYMVVWTSAPIVREADKHLGVLQGRAKEEADPAPRLPNHVLTVLGSDLRAFEGVADDVMKNAVFLRPKGSKSKTASTEVMVQRGQNGRITAVNFAFPRQIEGAPLISEEENSVEFICELESLGLKTKFDVRKMRTAEELGL